MPGLIEKSGASSGQRKFLFYGICFPLRLLLALFVCWKLDSAVVQGIVLAASATAVYLNALGFKDGPGPDGVWWSRRFHMVTSVSILLCFGAGWKRAVPAIMIVDVFSGFLTSFARKPF